MSIRRELRLHERCIFRLLSRCYDRVCAAKWLQLAGSDDRNASEHCILVAGSDDRNTSEHRIPAAGQSLNIMTALSCKGYVHCFFYIRSSPSRELNI